MCARPEARSASTCSLGTNASCPVTMAAARPPLSTPMSSTICLAKAQRAALTFISSASNQGARAASTCRTLVNAKPTPPIPSKKASRAKS